MDTRDFQTPLLAGSGMLGLILYLVCTGLSAWRIADLLAEQEPEPLTGVERGVWTGVIGLCLWLAQACLLSFVGWFRPAPLVALSVLFVAFLHVVTRLRPFAGLSGFAAANFARRLAHALLQPPTQPASTLLPLALVGICLAYSVASLTIIPVSNHDALSYHFPKAVQLMLTGAFGLYPSQDLRVTYFPGNYEALVATFLTFLHSDRATGLATSAPLLLFFATSYAFLKRVWRDASTAALATAMMLASPVLFLHFTAHKNDILMGAAALSALVWLGRYATSGGLGSGIVGVLSLALGAGTKFHGLLVVLASTMFFWKAWRRGTWRPTPAGAVRQAAYATALFFVLGSVQYVANIVATGQVTGILATGVPSGFNTIAYPAYWQIPRFTWMLLLAPIATHGLFFIVPWSTETWFWPAYELYFSHYGIHVSVFILMLPLGVWWTRRQLGQTIRAELATISLATGILVVLNMMIGLRPYGAFGFIPRFLFFALPVLMAWTWCPAVTYLRRVRALSWLAVAASLVVPIAYVGITVTRDTFSPIDYVGTLWGSPDQRRNIYQASWRAASFVDRVAASDATIAVDGSYDGWTYPVYGAQLSRTVEVIMNDLRPYVPGPEVNWVVVDRTFSIMWGHPNFQRMSQAGQYLGRGSLTADDKRVYESLVHNPDFKLVYFDEAHFQAVFQRVRR